MAQTPPPVTLRPQQFRPLIITAVVVLLLLTLVRMVPTFYVDVLWFRSVGFDHIFFTTLFTKVFTQFLFGGAFLIIFLLNVMIAIRKTPPNFAALHELRMALPAIEQIRPALRAFAILVGLMLAFMVGRWGESQWLPWLQFRHAEMFGVTDPVFGRDLGFYVYVLPFIQTLTRFAFFSVFASAIGTAVAYLFQGQLWARPGFLAINMGARRHLMILLSVGLLLFAFQDMLARFGLLHSTRGIVAGAGYADLHGSLPGLTIAAALTAVAALMVLIDSFGRSYRLTWISFVVVVVAHLALVQIWPFALQRLVVTPNEINRERPYLEREIEGTRLAFGLEDVDEGRFPANQALTAARVSANRATIDNVRLWETQPLKTTNSQLQEIRTYYDFVDVDNDRYVVNGELRQVALSTRELNPEALPARIWINEHLTYTHGYGVCIAPVNRISTEGLPEYFVKNIPPESSVPELEITRPEIYYGELAATYVFVNSAAQEFDYPSGDENVYTTYEGIGGIPVGGFGARLLFALKFAEPKILLSSDLTEESRILLFRTVRERVTKIAPFLAWEVDPYIVVRDDGSLTWMLDGYTVTDRIPYSAPMARLGNYIRNPVKATIDAYNGTVTFWAVDAEDPLLRTYENIFPGTFKPMDEMPEDLQAHMRYPEGLMAIQAQVYATYHMTDAQVFYNKEDLWRIARREDGTSMRPYFTVMKLAGVGEKEEFILMLPFTPSRKENMIAWMSARCDPPHYGKLLVYSFPKQRLVYGPTQIESRINQDTEISKELTLWNQQGSQVIRGNLLVVPIDSSLVYFQPLYLQAQSQAGLPELKRILVAFGDRIAMETTMADALARVFGAGAGSSLDAVVASSTLPSDTGVQAAPGSPVTPDDRLREAAAIYRRAEQALRRGDLQDYAREIEALGQILTGMGGG